MGLINGGVDLTILLRRYGLMASPHGWVTRFFIALLDFGFPLSEIRKRFPLLS